MQNYGLGSTHKMMQKNTLYKLYSVFISVGITYFPGPLPAKYFRRK